MGSWQHKVEPLGSRIEAQPTLNVLMNDIVLVEEVLADDTEVCHDIGSSVDARFRRFGKVGRDDNDEIWI